MITNKRTNVVLPLSVTILGLFIPYIIYTTLQMNYIYALVLLFTTGIFFYIYLTIYPENNHETSRNKPLMIFSQLTNILVLLGLIIESKHGVILNSKELTPILFNIYYLVVCLLFAINLFCFIHSPNSKKLKFIILLNYMFIYIVFVMTIYSFWVLFVGVTLLNAYTMYGNKKLILGVSSSIHTINLIAIIRHTIATGVSNDKYSVMVYFMEFECLTIYSFILIYSSFLVKDMADEKIELVEKEDTKINELTKQVIKIVQKVNSGITSTHKIADELDTSMSNSLHVIHDIAEGNSQNTSSVEEQAQMSNNISDMISEVVVAAKDTTSVSAESLIGVANGKNSFQNIKNKSSDIVKNNKEVLQTINEFVNTTKNVKKISDGIQHLTDETNLLSFNASVKSAKAGEEGKGFSVVASEIRNLALLTTNLLDNINTITQELEDNAIIAQNVVNNVVESVNIENQAIDATMQDFIVLENNIEFLNNNIEYILNNVEHISNYNIEIENHITQLSCASQQVLASTEEAVKISSDNTIKTETTRSMLANLKELVNKLDTYQLQSNVQF